MSNADDITIHVEAIGETNYGKRTKKRDEPMSRNTASETGQISLWWIKRLKKLKMVVMASRSLSATSMRVCVRMTTECTVHRAFRNEA
jgi:hypothetical protein